MKKRFRDFDYNKIRELVNSPDLKSFLDEIPYCVEQLTKGKLFFNPDKMEQFKDFFGKSIDFYQNEMVQIYVDQYNEFNSLISEEYPVLFQREKEFSQKNIFNKTDMAHPMENVKKAVLFYNESVGSELMSRVGQLSRILFKINSKTENQKVCDTELMDLLKATLKFLKDRDNGILDFLQNFISNIENFPDKKEFSETINQLHVLIQLQNSSLKRLKNNPVETIKNFLIGIQDTQSHIEYFCRYFHRLIHIMKHGNQEYNAHYYDYNSNQFDEEKFLHICKTELNDFPELQKFLRRYCVTFKDLRNIRAHQIAGEAKISSGGFISIPDIRNEKGKCIDYKEKREKMIIYGVFINKIKLHLDSPYDESEDLFVSLD